MSQSIKHLRGVKGVYRIIGPGGCSYIGSAVDIRQRWCQHRWYLGRGNHNNTHLQRAWNKYGAEAFTIEVVEVVNRSVDLISAEQRYLDELFSGDPAIIYNMAPTAGSLLGFPASEERKRKIGDANRGRVFTAEHRRHMSEAHKGQKPTNIEQLRVMNKGKRRDPAIVRKVASANRGKKRSAESVERMAEAQRGAKASEETRQKMSNTRHNMSDEKKREIRERAAASLNGGKKYTIVSPSGDVYSGVINLAAFGAAHGLKKSSLYMVARGDRTNVYGWRITIE